MPMTSHPIWILGLAALAQSVPIAAFTAATADDAAELIRAWHEPQLGAPTVVAGLDIEVGHMRLELASGAVAPVLVAGKRAGLFFEGSGRYVYTSENPHEAPAIDHNARRGTKLVPRVDGNRRILGDEFTRLLLLAAATDLPNLDGAAGPDLTKAFVNHREWFSNSMAKPEHLFVQQALDAPAARVVWAEIEGREKVVYGYDAVEERAESLRSMTKSDTSYEGRRILTDVLLSRQAIGHDWREFEPPSYLLTDVDFTLVASGAKDARISVTETLVPLSQARRVFRFGQLKEIQFDGERRAFAVESVTDARGNPVTFHHDRHKLLVALPQPVAEDEAFKLRFEIAGDFLYRPEGDAFWLLGTTAWFPQPGLSGQYYTVHAEVQVEKPFIPIVPGTTIRRAEGKVYNTVETRIDKPVQFMVVAAGKYHIHEEEHEDVTIRVASYALRKKRAEEELSSLSYKIIKFYEQFLGPFPFGEFNIIEINSVGWGQAPPGTMFITREAFNPLMNQAWSRGINDRFAHEIAHQYWGHVVKMGSEQEEWLVESFAEYSAALVIKQLKGQGGFNEKVRGWRLAAKPANDHAPIALANRLSDIGIAGVIRRVHLLYDKGPLVLHELHNELGDGDFASFLRNYQRGMAWKFGTTGDMIGLLNAITKEDYTPFFERYYWGTEMPQKGG